MRYPPHPVADLTPAHRRVIAALSSFDPCCPSLADLGRRARTSRRATQKLLLDLVAAGEVTVVEQPVKPDGKWRAPLYVLTDSEV